jgi:predicted DNA-binding protein with PD1-like motif
MNSARLQLTELSESRIITERLTPGTELISGIKKICTDNALECGAIVCGIGSLKRAELICVKPNNGTQAGIKYSNPVMFNGPIELLSCQGMIGHTPEGEISLHIHGIICDSNMKLYGGHFVDGCITLVTVEITIIEITNTDLLRELDEETGFSIFKFYSKKK